MRQKDVEIKEIKKKRTKKRNKFRIILFIFIAFIGILAIIPPGIYFYFTHDLPKITSLKDYRPPIITSIYSSGGELIGEYCLERRIVVSLEKIPKLVRHAFIATEDARFFEHPGIDYRSVLRAFLKNLKAGVVVQGGSTITQQITKSLLLSPEKSYRRKIREAILSYRIEKYLTKQEILFLYLNQIYLGNGAYGVEAASRIYFKKHVEDLNPAEAAMLAGLPRAPNRYSPLNDSRRAARRRSYVLNRMAEEGYITSREAELSKKFSLCVSRDKNTPFSKAPYYTEHIRRYIEDTYGEEMLYKEGLTVYTSLDLFRQKIAQKSIHAGLKNLDKRIGYRGAIKNLPEDEIEDFCRLKEGEDPGTILLDRKIYQGVVIGFNDENESTLIRVGDKIGILPLEDIKWARKPDPEVAYAAFPVKDPSRVFTLGDVILIKVVALDEKNDSFVCSLEQEPEVQGALICLESQTGYVEAMVGGRSFLNSQFNRAVQSRRQPGSAFKPIIFAAALEKGFTASTMIIDSPVIYYDPLRDHTWKPKNYEKKFYGPTTLSYALTHSRNVVTVKVLKQIGIDYAINYARKLGISSPLSRDLSLALGSSGVSLLELTAAYSVFANQGYRIKPIFVKKIVDREGNILEENKPPLLPSTSVALKEDNIREISLSEEEAESIIFSEDEELPIFPDQEISEQIAYLITNMLERVVQHGTGWRIKRLKRPVAGKTGTTNNLKDAWFMGFTPGWTCGVWVGLDDEKPLGVHETGSRAASPIWLSFMKASLKGSRIKDFTVPEGIVFSTIDSQTGLLATSRSEETIKLPFLEGTAPLEYSIDTVLNYREKLFELDLEEDEALAP